MNSQKKFDLNDNFKNMFRPTNPETKIEGHRIANLDIGKLVPFKNHPFKLYEGERFSDMVGSIEINGIIMPIITRLLGSEPELYEILSGHNRVEAAKAAGLETVPAIIRGDLSDDEALLIVTETNLIQRSFGDLAHSERAAALSAHHEAVKGQGKRTDLIEEIEKLLKNPENISNCAENETLAPMVQKLAAREKTAQNYGLNRGTVTRYLKINQLSEELKEFIDSEDIAIRAGVELSYISMQEQSYLSDILKETPERKVDIKKAVLMREFSKNNKLTQKAIGDILDGAVPKKKKRASLPIRSLKIGGKILSEYFKAGQTSEEIQAEIFEALGFFRARKESK